MICRKSTALRPDGGTDDHLTFDLLYLGLNGRHICTPLSWAAGRHIVYLSDCKLRCGLQSLNEMSPSLILQESSEPSNKTQSSHEHYRYLRTIFMHESRIFRPIKLATVLSLRIASLGVRLSSACP